tara:strand:- start:1626 stop:2453 length:828 start_codon:yes stop_codon:yes gene_type:complete
MPNSRASQESSLIDPLRLRLEKALIKARWFASIGFILLFMGGQFELLEAITVEVLFVLGNCFVILLLGFCKSVNSQRVTGFIATLIDSFIALTIIFISPTSFGPSIYAILILVAIETAVRYAPIKGFFLTLILSISLGIVVELRNSMESLGSTNLGILIFWASLIIGIGLVFGTIIREIYRQRVIPDSVRHMVSKEDLEILTPREIDVFNLISNGYSNQEIADELVIEVKTVKNHINNMYSKLNMSSRYQAISRSVRVPLLKDAPYDQPENDANN